MTMECSMRATLNNKHSFIYLSSAENVNWLAVGRGSSPSPEAWT